MKHFLRKTLPLLLTLALALGAAAPGAAAADEEKETPGLTISPEKLDLNVGKTGTLTAKVISKDGKEDPDAVVTWTIGSGRDYVTFVAASSDEDDDGTDLSAIRIYTATGRSATVRGLTDGTATITAECDGLTATCDVTVSTVSVESVKLSAETVDLQVGDTKTLTATLSPENATNQTVTWSFTGTSVIRLDKSETRSGESVTITALRTGTTTITALAGDSKRATCEVTVSAVEITGTLKNNQMEFDSSLLNQLRSHCESITGSPLSYLINISVNTPAGTLYEGYVSEADHGEGVSSSRRYDDSTSGDHQLSKITFVPRPGFTGTATIIFTAYGESGGVFTGSIVVNIPGNALTYTSEDGSPVCFQSSDFTSYSQTAGNSTVRYVRFDLPSSRYGTLYYNYIDSEINEGPVTSSELFYRVGYPSLDRVWFVPNPSYSGSFTITFTYTDTSGSSFPGSLLIHVVNAGVNSAGSGGGSLSYSVRPGDSVWFGAADFNDLSYDETGYPLSYLRFTSLPASSRGSLYCSGHGAVTTSQSIYRSGTDRRLLSDVYFLAREGYSGTVPIPFTGYATNGESFYGTVEVTVSGSAGSGGGQDTIYDTGSIITYSSSGEAVTFRSQDFFYDAAQHLSQPLTTLRFYTPEVSLGRLCTSYTSPTSYAILDASQEYPYTAASSITFQPRAGFSGAAYIRFIGSDQTGKSYTGTVAVNVNPPAVSTYFGDLAGYSWALPSVDLLARHNVLIGTEYRVFSPAGMTKRGDFILMLQRCFNFPSAAGGEFADVPSGSYYGSAIAGAYAIGLATGDGDGNFRPDDTLTRQEAAEFLYRCMKRTGSLSDGTEADLESFSDRDQIAPYAMTAMATLVRLGVLAGDGGRLNPSQVLTRAEMAVMFHRALT